MMKFCLIIGWMSLMECTVSTSTSQFDSKHLKDSAFTSTTNNNSSATHSESSYSTQYNNISVTTTLSTNTDTSNESYDSQPTGSDGISEINPLTTKHKTIFFISATTTFFILICSACISNLCDYSKLSKQKLARSHA